MTFLNPAYLYGLGAALLPLLIHLLNRRRAVTVPFSNVALLRQLQQDRMRRVKLRQIVLLILRTLILLLIALSFARPALRGSAPGGAHVRTAAALLLDQSYGMGYRTPTGQLFDQARSRAEEALRLLDGRDHLRLIPFSDRPLSSEGPAASGASGLREQLAEMEVTHRAPRVLEALKAAGQHLTASGEAHREVYLFTNLARPGWEGVADSLAEFEGATVYAVLERPGRVENLAVTRLSASNQIVAVGAPVAFEVEVLNAGESPEREAPVRFSLGGRRVEQTVIGLQAGERRRLLFHATPEASGRIEGVVEAGDDPLPADNLRHVVVDVPGRIEVLLVGETAADAYYVERAFATSAGLVAVRSVTRDRLSDADVTRSDLIVLCDVSRLSPGQTAAVRDRVRRGGGVLIFLGDRVDVASYNQRILPDLLPVRLVALRGAPGKPSAYRGLGAVQRDHPLFRDLLPERFDAPKFYASYDVEYPETVRALARYGDGGAALCEARLGAGRALLLTSAADLRWTDLPLRGIFVPLLHRMAQYAVARTPVFEAHLVGQTAERPVSGGGGTAEVVSPDGSSRTVRPHASGEDEAYRIGPLETPGVWRIRAGGREVDRFACAVDAARGADLTALDADRLARIFGRARLRVVGPNESLTEVVSGMRYGQELWRPCLTLALALMAAEMLLGRASSRRETMRQEGGKEGLTSPREKLQIASER